jgi:putative phosphoesterase
MTSARCRRATRAGQCHLAIVKLAVISDLHADVHALRDALAQIDRLRCDAVVCAGDLVDIGLFPEETIALLIERAVPTIRGNHDRWALGAGRADDPHAGGGERGATGWDLSEYALTFLRSLPLSWSATLEGVRVAVHHGRAGSDMDGIDPDLLDGGVADVLLTAADADVLIVGHTHRPFDYHTACGKLIANPGALVREGQAEQPAWVFDTKLRTFSPTSSPPRGTFGVLHLPSRRFVVHRASDGAELPRSSDAVRAHD